MNTLLIGFLASLAAGLGTSLGALPAFLPFNLTERVQGILLGIGGGIMLAATSFSLLIPGTAAARAQGYSEAHAALIMVAGTLLGGWIGHTQLPFDSNRMHHRVQQLLVFPFQPTSSRRGHAHAPIKS
ncbi:MAG: hypothetical protein AAFZ80_08225, partial [Cyanobacteria bacterium P01_A01_bin.105]